MNNSNTPHSDTPDPASSQMSDATSDVANATGSGANGPNGPNGARPTPGAETGGALNPYAAVLAEPINVAFDQTVDDDTTRFYFSGQLTPDELRDYFRRPGSGIAMIILGVLSAVIVLFGFRWSNDEFSQALKLIVCLLLGVVVMSRFLRRGGAKQFASRHPFAIGSVKGFLSPHRLVLHREHMDSEFLLNALLEATELNDAMLLCFDPSRIFQQLLPLEFFAESDREPVRRLLLEKAQASQPQPQQILDDRLIDNQPLHVQSAPADGVVFDGKILAKDIDGTPLARALRRQIRVVLVVLVLAVGMMTLPFLSPPRYQSLSLLGGAVGFGIAAAMTLLLIRVRKLRKPEQCLFQTAGWVCPDFLYSVVATGSSVYRWSAFSSFATTDSVITFRIPGKPERHVLVARRTFPSEEAWQQAKSIVQQQFGTPQ